MQRAQVDQLNQLEDFLRQPDAVMEPNILSVLRRYISDNGKPAEVVEMLSDSYAGELAESPSSTGTTCLHCLAQQMLLLTADKSHASAGYAQMASLVVEWTKGLQDEELAEESASIAAFDEAYYLRVDTYTSLRQIRCLSGSFS